MPLNMGEQAKRPRTLFWYGYNLSNYVNSLLPSREKTNIVDSAQSIDPDQHKHAELASVSGIITLYLYLPETELCRPG